MACIIAWNDDGVSGVVHALKEGLIEEKVVSSSCCRSGLQNSPGVTPSGCQNWPHMTSGLHIGVNNILKPSQETLAVEVEHK